MPDYVETSAVLSWLLQEAGSEQVAKALNVSNLLVCSELTFVECSRAMVRLHGTIPNASLTQLNRQLQGLRTGCHVLAMTPSILTRVGQPFAVEPIRTLDAIHLATALELMQRGQSGAFAC